MNALTWLKIHNHLYKNVTINHEVLANAAPETLLPFHIQHNVPTAAMDATTSDYVPAVNVAEPLVNPDLSEILTPPLTDIPFQTVIVADVAMLVLTPGAKIKAPGTQVP
ncbi:hypothetical protein B0H19DRAFT_1257445 [Mycena capillaripes]|nr:hypothetical protein B0H19DRAFT_1257445 [Mycena capillaripes]